MVSITYGHGALHECDTFPFASDSEYEESGVADAGGDETHTVDAARGEANDYWNGYYIKYVTGDNAGTYKQITSWVLATHTFTHGAFANTCDADDVYILSRWAETDANSIATWTVDSNDYFKVTVTAGASGQTAKLNYHLAVNLVGSLYTKLLVRWKTPTRTATPGVKAGLIITYLTGSPDTVDLGYSDTDGFFKVNTITLASRTIDKVAFTVTRDGITTDPCLVWFDFFLIVKNIFTFPNATHHFIPPPRYAIIPIFGRGTDITQGGGSESAEVHVQCDLNVGDLGLISEPSDDWKRPQGEVNKKDYVRGEVFMDISHNTFQEPWQWLDTGSEQFKATLERPDFGRETQHTLNLVFREYSRCDKNNESYVERFGLNL